MLLINIVIVCNYTSDTEFHQNIPDSMHSCVTDLKRTTKIYTINKTISIQHFCIENTSQRRVS